MKTTTLKSLSQLSPAIITNSPIKASYRPRYRVELCEAQKLGYQRIIKGLSAYSKEEVKLMSEEDKRSIIYRQNRAWAIINTLKQKRLNKFLNGILQTIIPNLCGTAVPFLTEEITDNNFIVHRDLIECNVPTLEIIQEFCRKGILPRNFLA